MANYLCQYMITSKKKKILGLSTLFKVVLPNAGIDIWPSPSSNPGI